MLEICVCIGSGCHLKGAHFVVKKLKNLIAEHAVADRVRLRASFCQEHCTEGVVVRVDGAITRGVTPENVEEHFHRALEKL